MTLGTAFSVVVIEDHPELEQTITALLERAGDSVRCTDDPDAALELLRTLPRPCMLLWDPLTSRVSMSVLVESALRGVHVATLPIGLTIGRSDEGGEPTMTKRLTSPAAILSIVREHCPHHKETAA